MKCQETEHCTTFSRYRSARLQPLAQNPEILISSSHKTNKGIKSSQLGKEPTDRQTDRRQTDRQTEG